MANRKQIRSRKNKQTRRKNVSGGCGCNKSLFGGRKCKSRKNTRKIKGGFSFLPPYGTDSTLHKFVDAPFGTNVIGAPLNNVNILPKFSVNNPFKV